MKTKGMKHQIAYLAQSNRKRNFAVLAEQGTGKSWMTMADFERAFIDDKIDAVLIFAPNGVASNWTLREIPAHLEVETVTYAWRGKITTKREKAKWDALFARHYPRPVLRVFAINYEAVNTAAGYEACEEFLRCFRVFAVADESTRIKNPMAKRTQKVVKLGRLAEARRILSGTPLTKDPRDLFSQFDFLRPGLLGTTSYRAFVAEYAHLLPAHHPMMQAIIRKTGGRGGIPQVVEEDKQGNKMWKNLDRLSEMIQPHSFRVRKADCLDLPSKIYKRAYFELEPEQRRIYDLLKEDYELNFGDGDVMTFEAIAARTKMKQVTSGFVMARGELVMLPSGDNPRMKLFKEIVEDVEGQFIVWAMFTEEIDQVAAALRELGINCATYDGRTSKADRERIIDEFQAGKITAFVGHAAAAGIGITLTAAETAIYYSCSFDNELRLQSEDRCHRIGTKNNVVYIDLIAEDTIDEDTIKSLSVKTALADYVIDRSGAVPAAATA